MRSAAAWRTNFKYCSANCSTEILRRSTFWVRDSISSTSSGPSNPSTSTINASAAIRSAGGSRSAADQSSSDMRGSLKDQRKVGLQRGNVNGIGGAAAGVEAGGMGGQGFPVAGCAA